MGADILSARMVLVPAPRSIVGQKMWWMPAWLDRILPSVDIEGEGLTRQTAITTAAPVARP